MIIFALCHRNQLLYNVTVRGETKRGDKQLRRIEYNNYSYHHHRKLKSDNFSNMSQKSTVIDMIFYIQESHELCTNPVELSKEID